MTDRNKASATRRTSAEIRAGHKKHLFGAVANFYQEPTVLVEGHGTTLTDSTATTTSTSSGASSPSPSGTATRRSTRR